MVEILKLLLNDGRKNIDRSSQTTGLDMAVPTSPAKLGGTMRRGYEFYPGLASPRIIGLHSPAGFLPPHLFSKGKVGLLGMESEQRNTF